MNATVTATSPMIDHYARNYMCLMAWVMTFLCGWVMFLSAHARGSENAKQSVHKTVANTAAVVRQ